MQHKRKVGQLMKQKRGPAALLTREHLTNNLENELFSVNKNKPKRVEEKKTTSTFFLWPLTHLLLLTLHFEIDPGTT